MEDLFTTEEYQDFKEILMRTSSINQYTPDQHNMLIDFLADLDIDAAKYVIEMLGDFFLAGFEYANKGGARNNGHSN